MSENSNPVTNRSEIVYLYDAVDANPNGDPLTEENRPRVDDYTEEAIVTDVRLKRYVRDYLDRHGYTIFIKKSGSEGRDDKGDRYDHILEDHVRPRLGTDATPDELERTLLDEVIDIRLFGDSMAFDESPIDGSYTGPVQFNFGRSMHPVHQTTHGKTSVLSADSADGGAGGNMFSEHRLAYALIRFHGVIDEHSASDTRLTEDDVSILEDALWDGLRSQTNTSSKRGHEPRLLVRVEYEHDGYQIGDLHQRFSLEPRVDDPKAMRDISHLDIVLDEFLTTLSKNSEFIAAVSVRVSQRLQFTSSNRQGGSELLESELNEILDSDTVTVEHD